MPSQVDICNLALTRIGGEEITAIDEGTRGSRLCNRHYYPTLNALLREGEWNFAIKRVALAEDASAPVSEYAYRFVLPSDFIKLVRLNACTSDEYRIENGYVVTDEGTVTIEYVFEVTDENAFDPQFVDVFAQRLAAEICYALTENNTLTEQCWRIYANKLSMARTMDSRDGTPRDIEADGWIYSRF
jgi:hypothetical protein